MCSFSAVVCAQQTSYTGTLKVYVEGNEQYSGANTVQVTLDGNSAALHIQGFKIGSYAAMTIDLDCANSNGTLTTPATVTISPMIVSVLLGNVTVTDSNIGTADGANCNLDLQLHSSTTNENIRVVFSGTK